eukprot:7347013-Pyramimonas_sp.AAC.1
MCAALSHPPSMHEALADLQGECEWCKGESHILKSTRPQSLKLFKKSSGCARRQGESHFLQTTRPQPMKLLQMFTKHVRGAKAGATF